MHRRSLLRSLAALTPLALAGCGEYSSDPGTPPDDGGGNADPTGGTTEERAPVNLDALNVTYSSRHYESDGEAVAQVSVENTGEERSRAAIVVHFSINGTAKNVTEEIEVPGNETGQFRIPLGEPVEHVELEEFEFKTPSL